VFPAVFPKAALSGRSARAVGFPAGCAALLADSRLEGPHRLNVDRGLKGLTPQMEYTATGFSKPIRMIFKALFRPRREVQREYDYSTYFTKTLRFEAHVEEVFETRIYRPLNRLVLRFSRRMRALQAGSIQAYLIYIFITLLLLLLFAL
jgi:hydrogenase-4 component B